MIIDSHTHIGNSFWGQFSPEYLLETTRNADIVICSNLEGIDSYTGKDELECNRAMLEVSKKYSKIKPLAVCEADRTKNADNIRKLLSEHKQFVGLKFHPEFTKLAADSEKYDDYLLAAREYGMPCLYHSGHIKSCFSSPELIYKKAKQFPDVPVILGHLSTGPKSSHIKAAKIIIESIEQETATLYTDISWVETEDVIMLIDMLRNTKKGDYTSRILWASDAPVGDFNQKEELYSKNLKEFQEKILNHYKDEKLLNGLMFENAAKLFKL